MNSRSGGEIVLDDRPTEASAEVVRGNSGNAIADVHQVDRANGERSWLLYVAQPLAATLPVSETVLAPLANIDRTSSGEDATTQLRNSFREINRVLVGQSGGALALIAGVTDGKYLTLANSGPTAAFLLRANRLNRLTPGNSATAAPTLGVEERMSSRTPAVFELTLLPEDVLLLCGGETCETLGSVPAVPRELSGNTTMDSLTRAFPGIEQASGALAALVVHPARELLVSTTPRETGERQFVWILLGLVFVAILIAALLLLI